MTRSVVTVATGSYVKGAARLNARLESLNEAHIRWMGNVPANSPPHATVPYGFKASALSIASESHSTLLWADACIYPLRSLTELWEQIERDGYWIQRNGWMNSQWTALDAYADLGITPEENARVPHVIATAFGVSTAHPRGREILREYVRLGLHTNAFKGPWTNGMRSDDGRTAPCGPPEVLGHRHDQTALSVIAWRAGCVLDQTPTLAYGKVGETKFDERTMLAADGGY